MADKSTNNIELKVLVDKGSNKVIFIEPDNDFVDVLFSFMTIPMGTIIRLARKHSDPMVIGCMNNLYESVENIDEQEFRFPKFKDMLLRPANAADFLCNCLKLKLDNAEPRSYFMCSKLCKFLSYNYGTYCPCSYSSTTYGLSSSTMVEKKRLSVASVFVKRRTGFIVADDLQVIPPSASTDSVLFTKLGVVDVHATEELAINIGTAEICNLLLSCLVSKTPLTETLLNPEQEPKLRSTILNQGILNEYQMSGDSMDDEEVKNMKDCSLKGCINHLYKTILDLDGVQNHHNALFINTFTIYKSVDFLCGIFTKGTSKDKPIEKSIFLLLVKCGNIFKEYNRASILYK
ncbi:uncharacterized protein LOC110750187 [Prunus avium]|uniref:Uncharacterized protein LOC110750187 n=1 Tax=Prunus avium TaxID=42229 RepID=A0A6P5RWS9_PRUAV|nr:uncharacterized protein LOC110750187 [Prunus avium]